MKLFFQYLKEKRRVYAAGILFFAIFLISFRLYRLPAEAVTYPMLLCLLLAAVASIADFLRVKRRHEALRRIQSITDVIELPLPEPETVCEGDYREIVRLISREHSDLAARASQSYEDTVDYYTVWAHQIKTPIASMRLRLEQEDSPLSRQLSADLNRVEQYVEMVLTFLRLDSNTTDYVLREYDLDGILRQVIRKFSYEFITRKLQLRYEPVSVRVVTDEKWLSFVLEQVLSNALKYTPSGSITVWAEDGKLYIQDTGMGIAPSDLPRVFDKGYTGFNGRADKKASGIGLYLCKRICTNLGHTITVTSTVDVGTLVTVGLARETMRVE